jgi:PAS domain-containing protein
MLFGTLSLMNRLAEALSSAFASLVCSGSPLGAFALAACVVASVALAFACGFWVMAVGRRAAVLKEHLTTALRETEAAVRFRDDLVRSLPEAVVVLSSGNNALLNYGGASELLEHCLAGPDAKVLAAAIDALLTRCVGFSLTARTIAICAVSVRGLQVGNSRALFLRYQDAAKGDTLRAETNTLAAVANKEPPEAHTVPEKAAPVAFPVIPESAGPDEGIIVIDMDGRLKQHNAAFAAQWSFDEAELQGSPHLEQIAALCSARKGRDATWEIVASAIAAEKPEQHDEWSMLPCAEGRIVAISASRRSDGGTLIKFRDVGEPIRAEAA